MSKTKPGHRSAPPVEYRPFTRLAVLGATAPNKKPWVHVTPESDDGHPGVWIPWDDFSDNAAPAKKRLRDASVILFGDDLDRIIAQAQAVSGFPSMPLIEEPGWNGPHFALPSGRVISPPKAQDAIVLFDRDPSRCVTKGGSVWKKEIGRLAEGQTIVTFITMLPLAAPLLRLSRIVGNPGFELAGAPRVGKSTLQQLAASVVGGALEPAGRNYWITANATVNSLEEVAREFNDLPFIIEEMSMFASGNGKKQRAEKVIDLVFRLHSGTFKSRFQAANPPPVRFVWLTSTNETLSVLLGDYRSPTAAAADGRLLTIPISQKRRYGIFDRLPNGCDTSAEAIDQLKSVIANNCGRPMRIFLKHLVKDVARDEAGVRARIEQWIQDFRDAVGVDENVGTEASLTDTFGLVYAAGKLGQEYGALPDTLSCLKSAKKVFQSNRKLSGLVQSNLQLLHRVARRKGAIFIGRNGLASLPDEVISKAPCIIRLAHSGARELLLTKAQLRELVPSTRSFFKDREIGDVIQKDGDRRTVKRTIRTEKRGERFYCFILGDNDN